MLEDFYDDNFSLFKYRFMANHEYKNRVLEFITIANIKVIQVVQRNYSAIF